MRSYSSASFAGSFSAGASATLTAPVGCGALLGFAMLGAALVAGGGFDTGAGLTVLGTSLGFAMLGTTLFCGCPAALLGAIGGLALLGFPTSG